MNPTEQYIHSRDEQVKMNTDDRDLRVNTDRFTHELVRTNYAKNFTWMGVPIIQWPSDLMVMQELIWKIKPDYIIETGVAFGGMTVFYANVLETIGKGTVIGIDIEIREHNHNNLMSHPLNKRIRLLEGPSTENKTWSILAEELAYHKPKTVLVSLDSNHSHAHVLQELWLYSPLVSVGSYVVVFDTAIEFVGQPDADRPWGPGNNPWGAVQEFMQGNEEFVVDREVEQRALITSAPGGWLRRIK